MDLIWDCKAHRDVWRGNDATGSSYARKKNTSFRPRFSQPTCSSDSSEIKGALEAEKLTNTKSFRILPLPSKPSRQKRTPPPTTNAKRRSAPPVLPASSTLEVSARAQANCVLLELNVLHEPQTPSNAMPPIPQARIWQEFPLGKKCVNGVVSIQPFLQRSQIQIKAVVRGEGRKRPSLQTAAY